MKVDRSSGQRCWENTLRAHRATVRGRRAGLWMQQIHRPQGRIHRRGGGPCLQPCCSGPGRAGSEQGRTLSAGQGGYPP